MPIMKKLNELDEAIFNTEFSNGIEIEYQGTAINLWSIDTLNYFIFVTFANRFFLGKSEDTVTEDFCERLKIHLKTFTPYLITSYKMLISDYSPLYKEEFEKKYFKKGNETEQDTIGEREGTTTNAPYSVTETEQVTTDNDTVTFNNKAKQIKELTQSTISTLQTQSIDSKVKTYGIIDTNKNAHEMTETERKTFNLNSLNEVENEIRLKLNDFTWEIMGKFIHRWTFFTNGIGGELF